MITLPASTLITRIHEATGIPEDDLKKRITAKLHELSGLISEEGAAHIIANELGVKLLDPVKPQTIDKLLVGMKGVEVTGRIIQAYEVREFSGASRSGKVGRFLMGDKTGTVMVVLWNDQADQLPTLQQGDIVRIKGGNVRPNMNGDRTELHLGEGAKLIKNPEGVSPEDFAFEGRAANGGGGSRRSEAQSKRIAELAEGDANVAVLATVVQVFEPRFFAVCPTCNARAREENGAAVCPAHGAVNPAYNYVMNLILDDGSDNIRCVLWREQVDTVLGKKRDEVVALRAEPAAFEPFKTELLGTILKIRGRVQRNEAFGRMELVAYEATPDVDPAQEVARLSQGKASSAPVRVVTERQELTVKVDEKGKASSMTVRKEVTEHEGREEELFDLEDIEDLEDLDDLDK